MKDQDIFKDLTARKATFYFYLASLICSFILGATIITIFSTKEFSVIFIMVATMAAIAVAGLLLSLAKYEQYQKIYVRELEEGSHKDARI